MIQFFTRHPTAANLLMVLIIVMGLVSIPSLRRETLPDFSTDEVQVTVVYPGATALDVEEAICRRIEDAIDSVSHIEEVRSDAQEGHCKVVIKMAEGNDFRTFMDDVKSEIDAIDEFPDQAEDPIVKEVGRTDKVVSVAVTGPMSLSDLKAYCEILKRRLRQDEAISLVEVRGFSEHQIQVRLSAQTIMQYGLSLSKIADVISQQSVDLPAGTIVTHEREILIRFTDERRTPRELEDLIVVSSSGGAELRLGDIAEIRDVFELEEEKILFNGKRAGILEVSKTKSEDALKVLDAVKRFFERENQVKPPMVRFDISQDNTSIVRDRLLMLTKNGWQGLLLVFFALWLFFSFRLSFWVAMGLPVSFLGAIFFMPLLDYSLNMITMVGLLLALGLLMDDAIVISENIASHLREGKSALQAAIDGTREVKAGVLSSFATTLLIFGPISLLTGSIGKILRVMPIILILVLSISLVEAFCILPHHLAHSLKNYNHRHRNRFRKRFDEVMTRVRDNLVGRIVDLAVKWRYLSAGLMIGLLIVSVGMPASGILKFKAFPSLDGDVIEARILLPQGTPLHRTEALVKKITQALEPVNGYFKPLQPGQQNLVKQVTVQYNKNIDAFENGPHVATVTADLLKAEFRKARIADVLNKWRESVGQLPDVIHLKFTEPALGPAGKPIEIRLKGGDLVVLKSASTEIQQWFRQFSGVFDIADDFRPGKPEVRIRMREGATSLGLTARMIADQLRSAFYGKTASQTQVGTESYEIDVRLVGIDQNSLADLEYFHITLPDGKQVPIGSVAALEVGRGYARIASVNGQRTITVSGDVDPRTANTAEIIGWLRSDFLPGFKKNFPNVKISIVGENKESGKTAASLQRGFIIGLIGIFILLSFQFRSYIEPLVVMVAIPFALIGVIWGHLLMGLELTMPSMLGFASLAGVVVNDSILLVQFIKLRRSEGQTIPTAVCNASRARFRAVLLTSLTTIAGLTPLLLEKSLQAQVLIPLATSIVFGIMASTLMVLFFIPALYAILGDLGLTAPVIEAE